jgi:hypothetical protein
MATALLVKDADLHEGSQREHNMVADGSAAFKPRIRTHARRSVTGARGGKGRALRGLSAGTRAF